jgi:methyl-accepting chemotaxis protein-1 (serine sensor receptor)
MKISKTPTVSHFSGNSSLFSHISLRTSITLVLTVFAALLIAVSALAGVALQSSNAAIEKMYTEDTRSLLQIKSSYERVMHARLALGSFAALYGLGDVQPALLEGAHNDLRQSDEEVRSYLATASADDTETALRARFVAARQKYLHDGLEASFDALGKSDFSAYKSLQGAETEALANNFSAQVAALEGVLTERQKARYTNAQDRFHMMLWLLAAAAFASVVIGTFARHALLNAIVKPVGQAIRQFQRIAAGDLTNPVDTGRDNEMGALLRALEQMQQSLVETVTTVRASTESINVGATEIASGNNDLSIRTEQQAASLETTASSMEQITATAKASFESARQAREMATHASEMAVKGGAVVSNVVTTMQGIAAHSKKISEITSVIDGIALNAAVEAARAGEQGRGFAVVAGEVRNLAQRSASAAQEIKMLIQDSSAHIDAGSTLVESAGSTIGSVVSAVERVCQIVTEISAAAGEQSKGIEQVNLAVATMDQSTQQNAALVEEAAAAAQSLQSQARTLSEAVEVFRL